LGVFFRLLHFGGKQGFPLERCRMIKMGIRNIEFINGEYYHVFNRGVDKRIIFNTNEQQHFYFRRLDLLNTTNTSKLIANQRSKRKDKEIIAE